MRAAVARDAARAELVVAQEDVWAGRDALVREAMTWAEDATRDEEWREERAWVTHEDLGRLQRRQ